MTFSIRNTNAQEVWFDRIVFGLLSGGRKRSVLIFLDCFVLLRNKDRKFIVR